MPSTIAVPDDMSETSSSSGSTVSDVAASLSSVALLRPTKEPKTITNLPPEVILQIYRSLNSPSEITALNSTSRMYKWIWRMNAASISSAVLSRTIECYNSALELFEVEERVKQIHCIRLPQSAALQRMRVAQIQARDVVLQGRRNDSCDHISSDTLYREVLNRNTRLLCAARDASYLLKLIENKVVYIGGTSQDDFDRQVAPPKQDIIIAYHEVMILLSLRFLEAMKARLQYMGKEKIRKMLYVATYLVCNCPDKDKIRLGISRNVTFHAAPWNWAVDEWDLVYRPRCYVIVYARRAFFAIADAVGDARIPSHLLENRSGCHGDCEEFGNVGAK